MKQVLSVIFLLLLLVNCTDRQEEVTETKSAQQDTAAVAVAQQEPGEFDRQTSSIGQQVYVPVYSHIYQRNQQKTFNLTTTLSIRNADPYRSFTLTDVAYYDSKGNLVQQYVETEQEIDPLASTSFVIEEADLRGGVGANFLVYWRSEDPVIPPVIEAVNISTSQQQGISFLSVGRVLQERATENGNE